jgi:hypothetical protein
MVTFRLSPPESPARVLSCPRAFGLGLNDRVCQSMDRFPSMSTQAFATINLLKWQELARQMVKVLDALHHKGGRCDKFAQVLQLF